MDMIKKISANILFCVIIASFGLNAFAASNKSSVSATWYVGGSGNGYVSGADNGKYYKLDKGTVQLQASCTNVSKAEPAYVMLYRAKSGFDAYYGSVTIKSSSSKVYTFPKKADIKSYEYYLKCSGGESLLYHKLSGTLYNK